MQAYEIFRRCFFLTLAIYLATVVAQADDEAKDGDEKPATAEEKFNDLVLNVPETWEKQKPSSRLRLGQLGIPAAEGDDEGGELVISSFQGGGGGVDMNIPRWIGEFSPEGRSIKVKTGKAEQGEYALADLNGTHLGTSFNRRKEPLENARMLVVVIHVKDENYFLKLTGPEKSITAAEKAFRASFGGNAEEEMDYEF
ncbi:MAG: hypothetical protein O2955_21375 [Planctomycetota bacterium]|nr:hypothetical protein [Planctomycetota bacterium]MDA1215060.1 hypothetical protein [Planctomycetota bacterium]